MICYLSFILSLNKWCYIKKPTERFCLLRLTSRKSSARLVIVHHSRYAVCCIFHYCSIERYFYLTWERERKMRSFSCIYFVHYGFSHRYRTSQSFAGLFLFFRSSQLFEQMRSKKTHNVTSVLSSYILFTVYQHIQHTLHNTKRLNCTRLALMITHSATFA